MIALFLICFCIGCNIPSTTDPQPVPNITQSTSGIPSKESTSLPFATTTPTRDIHSPTPINTQIPASSTPAQTATSLPHIKNELTPFVPVLGAADKIAFIEGGEIWSANLDGSALTKLTDDGDGILSLQWSVDGESLYFISGQCIKRIDYDTSPAEDIACFEPGQVPYSFQISPDGTQAAISVDYDLYVLQFDPTLLSQVRTGADLAKLGSCANLSPYKHRQSMVRVKRAYWSDDGRRLAILRQGFEESEEIELVHLLDISRCISPIPRLDEFPATRIDMDNYARTPVLQDFAWNGGDLFALTDFKRNDGFGDLWIYNTHLHQGFKANPIGGKCCYRDPVFSPDGKYLAFVFQDASLGVNQAAAVYLVPYAALDSSLVFPSLALPRDFFSEPRTKPQPALRPAP